MRSRTLRLALTGLLLLGAAGSPATPAVAAAAGGGAGGAAIPASIVDYTNVQRVRAGVAPLRANARLMEAAQLQAEQMASLGRMEHTLRGSRYPTPQDRLAAVGYKWSAFAENIAYGQHGPADVTESWMESAHHRTNMLNGTYTELGTGYAVDGTGRPYFVQVFGKPMS